MQIDRLIQAGHKHLVLFFNGWSAPPALFRHLELPTHSDCWLVYDYRQLSFSHLPVELATYDSIQVYAWSLGVWVASQVLPKWGDLPITKAIAINGTPAPLSRTEGIPEAAFRAREALRVQIAKRLQLELTAAVDRSVTPGPYSPDPESAGKRALKNLALYYLMGASSHHTVIRVRDQLIKRENLTDELAALKLIVDSNVPSKNNFEVETLQTYLPEPLLVNKWLTVQATTKTHAGELPVLERVRELMKCEFFSLSNPNNVYALLLAFFTQNPSEFHTKDGEGYKFWTEVVLELARINPHVAARVARTLENWRRYTPQLSRLQFEALENV